MHLIRLDGIMTAPLQSVRGSAPADRPWQQVARSGALEEAKLRGWVTRMWSEKSTMPLAPDPFPRVQRAEVFSIGTAGIERALSLALPERGAALHDLGKIGVPFQELLLDAADRVHDFVIIDESHGALPLLRMREVYGELLQPGGAPNSIEAPDFLSVLALSSMLTHGFDISLDVLWTEHPPLDRLVQRQGRMYRHGFVTKLRRLESAYLLAASLQAVRRPAPEESARTPPDIEHEPLAIACGLRRLSVPLVPRAPGEDSACDHAAGDRAVDRVTSRQSFALAG
ncbi:hypothetical protein ACFVH7_26340 [Kitasatospora indigofera]|uniref:hypothetical protein n=1 Tax=Kitasatospora indigofera TaxID=67307 RepID=UPI0036419174